MRDELWPAWREDVAESARTLHLATPYGHRYVTACGLTWDPKKHAVKGIRNTEAWPRIPVCSRCARRARGEAFHHRAEAKTMDAFAEREQHHSRWRPR